MEKQRLRNLTTGRLHTDVSFIYQDLEFITGMEGIMTHMLPNVSRAVTPWLKKQVKDAEYWDGQYKPELKGEHPIAPMNTREREEMLNIYNGLPSPFSSNKENQ